MAGYRVSSTDLGVRCSAGVEHIERANIVNGLMASIEMTGSELQAMQRADDSFVLIVGGRNELDWPSVSFDDCKCGKGVVMTQGKTANQLIQDALDKGNS